ncbi:MAG: phosphatidylserine decarboxylase [Verrucomicrobiota bacterium]
MKKSAEPIRFWNPYTAKVEEEDVYGERFLRFAYETPLGRVFLGALVKRAFFSKWYGWKMDQPGSVDKVERFIRDYGIEMSDYTVPEGGFRHFNDFFYRKLSEGSRPIAEGDAVFPADGRHLGIPEIGRESWLYAKGFQFRLETLLAGTDFLNTWRSGAGLISRLCPVDYHRFHAPVSGRVSAIIDLEGPLFSVSPIALRRNIDYLLTNKRKLVVIESPQMGRVGFIPVGATCVGSIVLSEEVGCEVEKGQELGYFRFGGSCVITLFEKGQIRLGGKFVEAQEREMEVYERMGRSLV